VEQVQRLAVDHQFVIIDGAPRIAELTRAILMLADLVLIPLGTSSPDIWATTDLLKTIEEARAHRPQLEARLVWNRVRSGTKAATELPGEVETELKVPSLKTRIGQRVAYGEAIGRGLTVGEWSDQAAKAELKALVAEVLKLLRRVS
jgi:chromosome partitioning protein